MIQPGRRMKGLILVLGDLLVFQLALLLTIWIRYDSLSWHQWYVHAVPFGIVSAAWIAVFYIEGLYDLTLVRDPLSFFLTYVEGMGVSLLVAVAFFYMLPFFDIAPRTNLLLDFLLSFLLGYGWRFIFNKAIIPRFPRGRVLFVGPASEVLQVDELLKASSIGLDLVAAISTEGKPLTGPQLAWFTAVSQLDKALQSERITVVVLGVNPEATKELSQALYRTLFSSVPLLDRTELEELITSRIPLSRVNQVWFLEHFREWDKAWYEIAKRIADVAMAIPFGVLTLVLYPCIAGIMKLTMPGSIFFNQVRVGRAGKVFKLWKFRTMKLDAEKDGPQFTADARTDPRLTRFGRFMRRGRIDELPQVWNVLKGDLSFIGPRPERPEFVAPLVERMPYYALRHLTRPGLTGWAQVCFLVPTASLEDNLTKLQYDLYYIKHRSFLLDFAILLKTIGIVLRREGT